MKKIILLCLLLFGCLLQAQQNKQEVTVDIIDALAMKTLELGYEYYLTDHSTVGLSALINFEKRTADFRYNEIYMITPFFRHYFKSNQAWTYFGEVFMGVNSGEYEMDALVGSNKKRYATYTDGALGVGVGAKYASTEGFVISALAGVGRNMFTDNSPLIVPRIGIHVGYRF